MTSIVKFFATVPRSLLRKRSLRWGLFFVAAAALLLFIFCPLITIRTELAYPWLRDRWIPQQEIQHFPKERPKGATTVGFYYAPGHYQAATAMEWRLKYLPSEFSNELKRVANIWTTTEDRRSAATYDKTYYWTFSNNSTSLVVRILHAMPTEYSGVPSWNHGNVYGYSVDQPNREIVYWIERW
jgi:hypothetical protein